MKELDKDERDDKVVIFCTLIAIVLFAINFSNLIEIDLQSQSTLFLKINTDFNELLTLVLFDIIVLFIIILILFISAANDVLNENLIASEDDSRDSNIFGYSCESKNCDFRTKRWIRIQVHYFLHGLRGDELE